MLHHKLMNRVLMACAVLSLASSTLLVHAETAGSCRDAANRADCMHTEMAKQMQEHEAKLHDALKLTAAQEPAWKAFTDRNHQQMAAMQADHPAMPSRAEMEKMSAPDLLQNHLAQEQKHLAAMQAHLDSLKQFYAVLTPEQQVIMNKAVERMHRHHGWHHWGHGNWGHEHGDRNQSPAGAAPAPATVPAPAKN